MNRMIVGLSGLIGSGKTTAAKHLIEHHGFVRLRFAGPLKAMMAALGLTEAETDGDLKHEPCDLLCGKTPRYAMQTIGTEWGRELIGPDLWIRAWLASVDELPPNSRIVADDVRFPNEAEAIFGLGGKLIRITRRELGTAPPQNAHISELHQLPADTEILNNNSIDDLCARVVGAIF